MGHDPKAPVPAVVIRVLRTEPALTGAAELPTQCGAFDQPLVTLKVACGERIAAPAGQCFRPAFDACDYAEVTCASLLTEAEYERVAGTAELEQMLVMAPDDGPFCLVRIIRALSPPLWGHQQIRVALQCDMRSYRYLGFGSVRPGRTADTLRAAEYRPP